ncbi:alpha/beta hydrolase [Burkholderia multivorans]|uniref:alpha/beta hydrolase n=1 Tax=Burkholderia multivorans TaxID=87883 RepID=UPI001F149D68|nr:alpha/beta hydrolase [Burkholderia multivorans]
MRTDTSFRTSDGIELKGWLYQPERVVGRTLPAIVMAHGFSGVKEQYLDKYAEVFCDAGFVVLVYDNRNFGESAGTPRQEIDPLLQVRDYRDGISYVSSLEFVDETRIGVWGSSYSGGHVLQVAAFDRRVKCVVSQVPAISGSNDLKTAVRPDLMVASCRHSMPTATIAFEASLPARSKSSAWIRIAAPHCRARTPMPTSCTVPVISPNWKNEITLRSIEMLNEYEPGYAIDRISPTPLLMIVALFDTCAPADQALRAYERALHPKALVTIPCTHFQAYIEHFPQTSGDALNWFEKHLKTDAEQG